MSAKGHKRTMLDHRSLDSCLSTKENVTVRSRRRRPREYLTEAEIDKLIDAAKDNRQGHRDSTAILMAYRHGLRAFELVELRWDDVDFRTGKLHVRRGKGGNGQRSPHWQSGNAGIAQTAAGNAGRPERRPYLRVRTPGPAERCWLSENGCAGWRGCGISYFLFTATCSATPAVTSLPMTARTPGRSNIISATSRSTRLCAILPWPRTDSRASGRTKSPTAGYRSTSSRLADFRLR